MQLSTTFRHMDGSQAVREYTAERLDKIKKYFHKGPISAHAVFSVERGFHHVADLSITLPNGIAINAKETTEDMYSSIDLAAARIERQVRKWKEKIRDHKPHGGPAGTVRELVIPAEEIEPRPATEPAEPASAIAPGGYKIIKDERVTARSMTVEDAVMQMNLLGDEHLIFTDAGTGSTSVLYRRRDGNYGLIETASGAPTGGKASR
ncbi:MAG TPA: ribosome-associated translation inhibitor RaiA [Polyangia bacterium]|jgi:putative sigma-54 modulation protein|nr:ribosome-associated translation inhibitor RaiA [Polyangia bacterium]